MAKSSAKTVSFNLSENLYEELKEMANERKSTVTDILVGLIKREIAKREERLRWAYEITGVDRSEMNLDSQFQWAFRLYDMGFEDKDVEEEIKRLAIKFKAVSKKFGVKVGDPKPFKREELL